MAFGLVMLVSSSSSWAQGYLGIGSVGWATQGTDSQANGLTHEVIACTGWAWVPRKQTGRAGDEGTARSEASLFVEWSDWPVA